MAYRSLIADRAVVVSFATVTELRYGALRAGWGELRRRGLERDLARFVIVQPDDQLCRRAPSCEPSASRLVTGLARKIHEADRWIAVTAKRLGVELISDDGVFTDVAGLVVRSRS